MKTAHNKYIIIRMDKLYSAQMEASSRQNILRVSTQNLMENLLESRLTLRIKCP